MRALGAVQRAVLCDGALADHAGDVEDFDAAAKGINVEVVSADHQNKADIASSVARQWYDADGVDIIVDVPNSAAALAVNEISRERNKIFLNSGAATTEEAAEPADDGATGEVVGQEGMAPEEDMGQHIDAGGDGVMCVN